MVPENRDRLLKEVIDEDLPGGGYHLCVECRYVSFHFCQIFIKFSSRHFIDQETLDAHKGTKLHKKRLKCVAEGAYTIEEANAAGGSGTSEFYTKRVEKKKNSGFT